MQIIKKKKSQVGILCILWFLFHTLLRGYLQVMYVWIFKITLETITRGSLSGGVGWGVFTLCFIPFALYEFSICVAVLQL